MTLSPSGAGAALRRARTGVLGRIWPLAVQPVGGQRVALRKDGAVHYLHADHLGSTSLTTDAAGDVVARRRYHPYGEERYVAGDVQTDFGYTGQRDVVGTGLMYYHARYYHPGLGRFVSADSIVPEPGNPQSLNRYAYVKNNPMKYVDPSGHRACIDKNCTQFENPVAFMRERLYRRGRRPDFRNSPIEISQIDRANPQYGFGNTQFAYSHRNDIYEGLGGLHSGIDIMASNGTELVTMDYGKVILTGLGCFMGRNERGVAVRHGDYIIVYGHVTEVLVEAGDLIRPGTPVATVGSGHLHLEVRRIGMGANDTDRHDDFYNPLYFFSDRTLQKMNLTWRPYVDQGGELSVDYNEWSMVSYSRRKSDGRIGDWFDDTLPNVVWVSE